MLVIRSVKGLIEGHSVQCVFVYRILGEESHHDFICTGFIRWVPLGPIDLKRWLFSFHSLAKYAHRCLYWVCIDYPTLDRMLSGVREVAVFGVDVRWWIILIRWCNPGLARGMHGSESYDFSHDWSKRTTWDVSTVRSWARIYFGESCSLWVASGVSEVSEIQLMVGSESNWFGRSISELARGTHVWTLNWEYWDGATMVMKNKGMVTTTLCYVRLKVPLVTPVVRFSSRNDILLR